MAKQRKIKTFSFQGFDNKHYRLTEQYTVAVDALFSRATKEITNVASKENYNPEKPFSFDDYPKTKKHAQKIINGLADNITAVIANGSRKQWLYACQKNDEFVASIMDTSKLTKARLNKMQDRNLDALQTFQQRKINGIDLSQRVWKYIGQYKDQLELGLDVGLGEGRSAQQLSKDVRQNLQDPDRLFRRVRDKRGNLVLSKVAKAFHPGQGVYRSSYKNAMRLTRSEVNMAYRESDWLRWQQLDFVVGFQVNRSNHDPVYKCKICERLVGRYPKWFKFKGWHPQCRCYMTAILMDEETFDSQELSDLKSALYGKEYKKLVPKNAVTDFPQGFKDWVAENEERQAGWSSTPYFIRDNFVNGTLADGLKYIAPTKTTQVGKTEEQKANIQKRWDERQELQTLKQLILNPSKAPSVNMPSELSGKSNYLHGEDYTFDKRFFDLIDPANPIKLKLSNANKGAYYSPSDKTVHLFNSDRNAKSVWERKAVVYHEYGHGIDWQRNLRTSKEVLDLRAKQIAYLKKQSTYKVWVQKWDKDKSWYYEKVEKKMSMVAYIDQKLTELSSRIWRMKDDTFTKYGITKYDVMEQIGSTRDTIKSLVISYGDGHSTKYFKQSGKSEAEYLAHAFENTFIGNEVFKKYMPEIYNEMITYIRSLK